MAVSTTSVGGAVTARALGRTRRWSLREEGVGLALQLAAFLSVAITIGITAVLVTQAATFFRHVSMVEFLFGTRWAPLLEPRSFGVLPLVCGTFLVAGGSALIAIPVGIGAALYLSEYARPQFRATVKPVLEILAGIPTVVYGYFALTSVTPWLRVILPHTEVFNALSAAIVVAVMVLPLVTSLCDDAFRAVPGALRQGAYAVGATDFEVSTRIVLPAALSGVSASFVLALSRAIGETMAVALAAGARPQLTANPLVSVQTMTAYIVNVCGGDTPAGTVEYQTIFAVGLLLFGITLIFNLVGYWVLKRFREEYE